MKSAQTIKVLALVPLGLTAGVLLLFTLGETASGDWSGLGHLIQLLPVIFLVWLAWRRPSLAALLLLALAAIASLSYYGELAAVTLTAPFLLLVAPLLLSAILLFIAGRLAQPA
jgi:hypothetical protein